MSQSYELTVESFDMTKEIRKVHRAIKDENIVPGMVFIGQLLDSGVIENV